jgi:MOSC domain-containing protein YiiM
VRIGAGDPGWQARGGLNRLHHDASPTRCVCHHRAMVPLRLTIDPGDYDDTDALNTIARMAGWWQLLVDQVDDHRLDALEVLHIDAAGALLAELHLTVGYAGLASNLDAAHRHLRSRAWTDGERRAVERFLRDGLGTIHSAGRLIHQGTRSERGVVTQLSRSHGGVPKVAVQQASVSRRGLVGDRQRTRIHHGRPWQALCLWSAEIIEELRREGHPIYPGATGENATIAGIDWAVVKPGMQIALGEAVAELSMWAEPCRHNAQWFTDGEFARIHADRGPVSRIYASVVRPGDVSQGDPVVLIP